MHLYFYNISLFVYPQKKIVRALLDADNLKKVNTYKKCFYNNYQSEYKTEKTFDS